MSNCPLVSIVLPTYNGSKYIDQSIESVLAQTYTNWELIIVDDAATDDTPKRIRQHVQRDRRIRCFRHDENRRLPAALNTGFGAARGDFFSWTSDDNLYQRDALSTLVGFLQSHLDVGLVYADYAVIDERNNELRSVTVSPPEMLAIGKSIGPCFLYRRELHEKLKGYAEDLFLVEDYDFWLRAFLVAPLEHLHQELYLWREHTASLTSTRQLEIRRALMRSMERNLPDLCRVSRDLGAKAHIKLANFLLAYDGRTAAWPHLLAALKCNPWIALREGGFLFGKLTLGCRIAARMLFWGR